MILINKHRIIKRITKIYFIMHQTALIGKALANQSAENNSLVAIHKAAFI